MISLPFLVNFCVLCQSKHPAGCRTSQRVLARCVADILLVIYAVCSIKMQLLFAVFCQILSLVSSGVFLPLPRCLFVIWLPVQNIYQSILFGDQSAEKNRKTHTHTHAHRKNIKIPMAKLATINILFDHSEQKKGYIENRRRACKSFHLRKTGKKHAQPKQQSNVGRSALQVLSNYLIPWLKIKPYANIQISTYVHIS